MVNSKHPDNLVMFRVDDPLRLLALNELTKEMKQKYPELSRNLVAQVIFEMKIDDAILDQCVKNKELFKSILAFYKNEKNK